jgi:chromate transporter
MTIGMFIPAFSFTLLGHYFFEKVVNFRPLGIFLDAVTAAVIGLVFITG